MRYQIETEYIALNSARMKFMMLMTEEVPGRCFRYSLSHIYVTGNHRLCVLELFKDNKERIKENCQVEILTNTVLPQTISISDGVWAVAAQK